MNFVDEQNRAGNRLQFFQNVFQPFLEIAAIARARKQRAHIERDRSSHRAKLPALRRVTMRRAKPFGDGGFAHAGIADIKRIVFLAAAENLDRALNFCARGRSADRCSPSCALLVEIDAIAFERTRCFLTLFARFCPRPLLLRRRRAGIARPSDLVMPCEM